LIHHVLLRYDIWKCLYGTLIYVIILLYKRV
jgi:hypothetical protein